MIDIKITTEDCTKMAAAIVLLNDIQHLKYMSRKMLVDLTEMSDTKVRATLQHMVNNKMIRKLDVTQAVHKPRYYYTLLEAGTALLETSEEKSKNT